MLYYEDTKLRRRGEVCIGGKDVIYTRYNAKSLAEPLTRLPVQVTRYSAVTTSRRIYARNILKT